MKHRGQAWLNRLDPAFATLLLTVLAWSAIVIGFQNLSADRISFQRPDFATPWSPFLTAFDDQRISPYVADPFMNRQVAWDSQFYLSIATEGYDDPRSNSGEVPGDRRLSHNYAFMPLYPMVMRGLSLPLGVLGMNELATATLAGIIISIAGTIAATVALYDIARRQLGEEGGMRVAFFFLIFPTAFFLIQVYTEGLFTGLAFGSLALMQRRQLWPAAALAALAIWTRSTGVVLLLPLALTLLAPLYARRHALSRQDIFSLAPLLLPALSFVVWWTVLGEEFHLVQKHSFRHDVFDFEASWQNWREALEVVFDGSYFSQRRVFLALEFGSILLVLVAGLATAKRFPLLAAFSLVSMALAVAAGSPHSMQRYALTAPSVFILLAMWGNNPVFDRTWTAGSLMTMGYFAALFAQDLWVA